MKKSLLQRYRDVLRGKRQLPLSVLTMFICGMFSIAIVHWVLARWVIPRWNVDIKVRTSRPPRVEPKEVIEKQIERAERKVNSPEVFFALRTSEAGQIFMAMAASLINTNAKEKQLALSTNELINNMLVMQLLPPQCRYISPAAPENEFRIPLIASEISGTIYIPYWDRQYLVVGSMPLEENHGEAFFFRYPEIINGKKDIGMWIAPTLEHKIVPPNASETVLRSNGWVKSPVPFAERLTDIDRIRFSLDMLCNENVGR